MTIDDIKLGDIIGVVNSYTSTLKFYQVTHIGRRHAKAPKQFYSDNLRFSIRDIQYAFRIGSDLSVELIFDSKEAVF